MTLTNCPSCNACLLQSDGTVGCLAGRGDYAKIWVSWRRLNEYLLPAPEYLVENIRKGLPPCRSYRKLPQQVNVSGLDFEV